MVGVGKFYRVKIFSTWDLLFIIWHVIKWYIYLLCGSYILLSKSSYIASNEQNLLEFITIFFKNL